MLWTYPALSHRCRAVTLQTTQFWLCARCAKAVKAVYKLHYAICFVIIIIRPLQVNPNTLNCYKYDTTKYSQQQVCVQLPISADSVPLLAFAAGAPAWSADLIDRYLVAAGPQQQTRRSGVRRPNDGTDRQTDRRTYSLTVSFSSVNNGRKASSEEFDGGRTTMTPGVSTCWSRQWAMQKWMSRSRCRLGVD